MSPILAPDIAGGEPRPESRIDAAIREAREAFSGSVLAGPSGRQINEFDAVVWDLGHLLAAVRSSGNRRIYFTADESLTRPSTVDPLPEVVGNLLRAYIVHLCGTHKSVPYLAGVTGALRKFWLVVRDRRPEVVADGVDAFRWDTLGAADIVAFEKELHDAGYVVGPFVQAVSGFISFLQHPARRVIPRWRYQATPTTVNRHRRLSPEERSARQQDRLPTREALATLGELYWRTKPEGGPDWSDARAVEDRLLLCAAALMLCTGLRISELCTLAVDCLDQEISPDGVKQFVRFAALKSQWALPTPRRRWLSPHAARLFGEAYREILQITEPWREVARRLEADPNRIRLPDGAGGFRDEDELVTTEEALPIVNLSSNLRLYRPDLCAAVPSRGNEPARYRLGDVANEVQRERERGNLSTVVLRRRGKKADQLLSESLFVIPLQFLTSRQHHSLLVRSLTPQHVAGWLGGAGNYRCVLEEHQVEGAAPLRVRTHQFRHLINFLARKRGMPETMITVWMQRASHAQTAAYMHDAPSDMAASILRKGIMDGTVDGRFVDHLRLLPSAVRQTVLDAEVQASHDTTVGWCIANFAYDPCPKYGRCVGCSHLLVRRGDHAALVQIQGIRKKDERQLVALNAAVQANEVVSPEYRSRLEEQVAGAKDLEARILSKPSDGRWVPAFPDGESRFTPFSTRGR